MALISLNQHLEVLSYTGGSQEDNPRYGISNALKLRGRIPHCTRKGNQFDLVLKWTGNPEGFTATHFVIRQPESCTCPIKNGAVWITEAEPDVSKFNAAFDAFLNSGTPLPADVPKPTIVFEVPLVKPEDEDDESPYVAQEVVAKVRPLHHGHYAFVKLIQAHALDPDEESNIDIGFLGFAGFEGDKRDQKEGIDEIPASTNMLRPKLARWNAVCEELTSEVQKLPTLMLPLFKAHPADVRQRAHDAVKSVALSGAFEGKLNFFYADEQEDEAAVNFVKRLGSVPIDTPFAFILVIKDGATRFLLQEPDANGWTPDRIHAFCDDFVNGKLKPFTKSAPRPANDRAVDFPAILEVTHNTFDELVTKSSKDVFVYAVVSDMKQSKLLNRPFAALVDLIKDVAPNVVIARFDLAQNDPPTGVEIFQRAFEMYFFAVGKKDEPEQLRARGPPELDDMLTFVAENASTKFTVTQDLKERAQRVQKFMDVSHAVKHLIKDTKGNVEEIAKTEPVPGQDGINAAIQKIEQLLATKNAEQVDELEKAALSLQEAAASVQALIKKRELKRVVDIHADNDFKARMNEAKAAGRFVLVDWSASWCGPCRHIAPVLADLSELLPDITFLKVDVDDCPESAQEAGIEAMPTFHLIGQDGLLATIRGANKNALVDGIKKHFNATINVDIDQLGHREGHHHHH